MGSATGAQQSETVIDFSISGPDLVESFVGVDASRVRNVFEQGKQRAPRIVFIDEIDAAVTGRDLPKRDRVVIPGAGGCCPQCGWIDSLRPSARPLTVPRGKIQSCVARRAARGGQCHGSSVLRCGVTVAR